MTISIKEAVALFFYLPLITTNQTNRLIKIRERWAGREGEGGGGIRETQEP